MNASGAGKLFFDFFESFFERSFNHEWTQMDTNFLPANHANGRELIAAS